MKIARSNMRSHPRELHPPNPRGIQVGDVHHQGPNHPKVRVRRRSAFSGKGVDVSGVTSATSRTMALLGNQDRLLPQDPTQVGRKGVRKRLGVLAGSHQEALAGLRAPEIPDLPKETKTVPAVVRQLQLQFVWLLRCLHPWPVVLQSIPQRCAVPVLASASLMRLMCTGLQPVGTCGQL